MLRKSTFIVAAAVIWGGSAYAQDGDCTCLTTAAAGGEAVGQVLTATGQVLVSQANGLGPAGEAAPLVIGSQVITGPESSANIKVGECALAVAPNSEVTVSKIGANICLRLHEVDVMTTAQIGNGSGFNLPLAMFGGLAAGAATASAVSGGDDAASP